MSDTWNTGHGPYLEVSCYLGFEAYAHVPKENQSKLDNKAMQCIFVSYGIGVKGYKLWDPMSRKFV